MKDRAEEHHAGITVPGSISYFSAQAFEEPRWTSQRSRGRSKIRLRVRSRSPASSSQKPEPGTPGSTADTAVAPSWKPISHRRARSNIRGWSFRPFCCADTKPKEDTIRDEEASSASTMVYKEEEEVRRLETNESLLHSITLISYTLFLLVTRSSSISHNSSSSTSSSCISLFRLLLPLRAWPWPPRRRSDN